MKKYLFLISLFLITINLFCQTFVSTVPESKNVILEEYGGVRCGPCADGHKIANAFEAANPPGDVVIINIHAGGYAAPASGYPNYTTTWGNALVNQSNNGGYYPSGTANRHVFPGLGWTAGATGMGRGQWATAGNQTLAQSSYVNVAAKTTIDLASRELTVVVEAYYTGNGSNTNKLNVALLQNNIEGFQVSATANPSQVLPNGNYNHMKMLRHLLTGQWGQTISNTSQGSFYTDTITYTVPQSLNSVPYDLFNLDVVVFIAESTQEIISGSISSMEYSTSQPGISSLILDSASLPVNDYCITSYEPKITVRNNNNTSTANYDLSYIYNGGSPVSITETNLGQNSSRTTIFPSINITDGEHKFEFNLDVANNNSIIDATSTDNYNPQIFYTTPNNIVDFEINEGFQSYQVNSSSINKGFLENSDELSNFKITNRGNGSTRSLLFGIYDWPKDVSASLVFHNIDLSNTTSPSLKFSYAYTQRVGGTFGSQDRLIVEASYSCGKTWVTIFDKSGNDLRTTSPRNSFFYPLASDWDDVWKGLEAWSNEDDVIIRFRCISDNGNNLFLDDIQVLDAVGIEESSNVSSKVFPNPAENSATIELQGVEGENIKFELYNILGEIVFKGNYKPTSNFDNYNIDLTSINNGIYNLVLKNGKSLSTKKLQIVK
jgi:hypothetical protein